jgi:hypothetical protein
VLEILSRGGLVRFDGLLLRLGHKLWPRARAVSCFVVLCKTEGTSIDRGFGSREINRGRCRYAQMSLGKPDTLMSILDYS